MNLITYSNLWKLGMQVGVDLSNNDLLLVFENKKA